jgi:hypothetical protein
MRGFARASLVLLFFPIATHGGGVVVTSYYPGVCYQPAVVYYAPAVTYYVPSISYYAPAWPVYTAPVVCPPAVPYAVPTAAPPSQTIEPPMLASSAPRPAPIITESQTGSDSAKVAKISDPGAGERVLVGFWNVTGRDVTLTIDGRTRVLPRNRNLTVPVGRQFVWRVDQRPAQTERVPEGSSTMEIVVRQ